MSNMRCRPWTFLLLLLLAGCVSFEPRQLAPSITLSAEQIELTEPVGSESAGVEFGLTTGINESDSLSNIVVLPGVRVRAVAVDGPAAAAGLRAGDVILSVDGIVTDTTDALNAIARRGLTNDQFNFQLRRDTTVLEVVLSGRAIGNAATPMVELYRIDPVASRAGYRTELVAVRGQAEVPAARIVEFFPGSTLPANGLRVGDLILAVDGQLINSAQGLVNLFNSPFQPGKQVQLTVYRDQELSDFQVRLWDPGRRISRLTLGPLLRYESSLNPDRSSFSLIDLWLFSAYSYTRSGGEKQHSLLGLFNFSSAYGELLEDQVPCTDC